MINVKKMITTILVTMSIFFIIPEVPIEAQEATIKGGATTVQDAYNWGYYAPNKNMLAIIPRDDKDFWIKVLVPKGSRIYIQGMCKTEYEGMSIEIKDSNKQVIDRADMYDLKNVFDLGNTNPYMILKCDNVTLSDKLYYIHINRGNYNGDLYCSLSMKERIKTGRGTFNFKSVAINQGSPMMSTSGMDSSVILLNLKNNVSIPPNAIVKSISTSGTQSPSQGNVHHKLRPAQSSIWYTSKAPSPSSGDYTIGVSDGYEARQVWEFKYHVFSIAKSTMKNVKLTINWEYDLADTGYKIYK